MLLVDTNVLIDILQDDPEWADWSIGELRAQSQMHALAINPVIYAELSLSFTSLTALDQAIDGLGLQLIEPSRPALFLAGKAFLRYRRAGGAGSTVLAEFFIGAQAAVLGCGIVTRDLRRYRNYFPTVPLVAPTAGRG